MESDWNETDIAIVGMAGRFPGADDVGELWRNLRDGVNSVRALTDEELRAAGVDPALLAHSNLVKAIAMPRAVDCFDAAFFGYSPREAEVMDPQQRLLLECAWQALEDAGYVGETYPGPIGVFAGLSTSTYLLYQVMANPAVQATLDELHIDLGNSGDYLTTRISHKLNLTGPSYLIQSACSTGLVAVHAACQSLLSEECDMALAGSASINVRHFRGYLYQPGGIVSPDGCCRTFDAGAQGSIVGSGLGLVVLKRLADAVADGDSIRAVIKGSAINNDGALKVGYTAPSVEGQAKVIAEALARSGVDAADISYVEAHGSGTSVGDPIEVEALTRAFNADGRRQFCALGSAKTNLGHLATAAGITGLIKTVLALENELIPPSLHFERPNPEINFSDSPFYVNVELRPWPRNGGGPRRAGVSAFGFGGTNAHVVLEEAPALSAATPSARPHQLLLLGAKSPGALAAATANLAAHLRAHPELDLADVAYTLQRGRKPFDHRRALICRDRDEAVALLSDPSSEGVFTAYGERSGAGVAFLFPGLGDQHLHMAAGLYAAEPFFRAEVDRSCRLLERFLGVDLREVLYPERRPVDEATAAPGLDLRRLLGRGAEAADEASRRLDRTLFAHPATFVVEHALARLWMEWGVSPKAMIGYSLGEYTAACIAGVLSPEDALWLVAERARLIEELPAGAMLVIPLPEDEVLPRLGSELSLAAVNAPQMCVVAGSESAIAELEGELARQGIAFRRLRTAHAFHSRLMEPVAERLVESVRRLTLRPPRIPYLSNVTGAWITGREATDPEYWGRHLCAPVRFSAGLDQLFQEPGRFLLEVGPGQALSTFARQHPVGGGVTAVPCLGERGGPADQATFMRAVGRLWLAGIEVDGERFFHHERRRRVPLPTYPFERRRYWIDASPEAALVSRPMTVEQPAADLAPASPAAGLSEHPRPALRNAYVAPRDETERIVAGIWQRLLGVDEIGVHDDFFELGGHSFLTTVLVTELRQAFGVDVGIRELFEKPTVAGFAAAIRDAQGREQEGAVPVAELPQIVPDPASRHLPFPLTDVQYAYLIGRGDAFALGQVSTHAYAEVDGVGIDLARLTDAYRLLIERHDMLRAIVHPDGRQEILASVPPFEIATLDLRGRLEEEVAAALAAIRRQMSHQVLPSDRWPLYELRASLLDGDRVRLHFSFDFLIGDAWSLQVLLPELSLAYHGRQSELEPLSVSFRDYVVALSRLEESPGYQRALAYWFSRLDDFPLAPELPLATSPEAIRRPTFVRHPGRLETAAWQRLKARAARGGLTPSGLLLAAFAEVLTVWSKSPRFAINVTLFNRLPLHPQVNDLVGDFTSLTLLAIDNTRAAPFGERAQQVQKQLFDDLDHSALSGIRVLRELARQRGGHVPAMMPVVFTSTLTQVSPREALAGLGEAELGFVISQTPQVWLDHQVLEDPLGLSYSWDVVEGLFPPGTIEDMLEGYQALLARLVDEEAVWEAFRPVLAPERQLTLFAAANATVGPVPDGLLHEPFFAWALSAPQRVAVIAGDVTLTYGELAQRANALALRLRAMGAAPNVLVAVVMEKGWEQVVGVLAVLASGAAYLPIDPELPRARRFFLFANGGVEFALTQPHLAERLEWPEGLQRLVVSRELPADLAAVDGRPLPAVQSAHDLAYVIYTSGSTGNPKGVMIDHRGALNTVIDVNERFGVGADDRVLALSSLSFDLSVYDVFGLLAAGGTVVLPEAGQSRDPQHWAQLIDRHGVTLWDTVPALMEMLVDFGEVTGYRAASLRLVMLSGDWIPLRLPERIRALAEDAAVVSLGGATEASIWSILFPVGEVDPGWRSIPYGRAMKNQTFHVLDKDLLPRPVGVPGQLYIGGIGLAKGYWADPEKTASSFLVDPRTGERLYRTGDLGRYLSEGAIEFLGREDFQVKVGGFRIELGEIEAVLSRHPGIREVLVLAPAEERGGRRLVAYLVPAPGGVPEAAELRAFLSDQLPAYMVPADFVVLEAFPLTANGKVDRQALPRPQDDRAPAEPSCAPPSGPVEEMLAGIWSEVLKVGAVTVDDDFFALGGNSLLVTHVTSRLRARFGVELPLRTLFENPTLGGLARQVERQWATGDEPVRPAGELTLPREGELRLSFAQERLWFLDQLAPGSAAYNIFHGVRLRGPLDPGAVAGALNEVVRRHESLRTSFAESQGQPVQVVSPAAPLPLPLVDLGGLPAARREPLLLALAAAEVQRPFDLRHGPLVRAALVRLAAREHALLLSLHHIVSDGWSAGVLVREVGALYAAGLTDAPSPLPELPLQYVDYALWQRQRLSGERLGREIEHWRQRLSGLAPLELPTDRPRPAVQTSRGSSRPLDLGEGMRSGLMALGRQHQATLFMVSLAGFVALLARHSGQRDLAVGTPVAGRTRAEIEDLIGFFVNTLVLRFDLAGDPTFEDLLVQAREVSLGAFAHQEVPFEKVVEQLQPERSLSRSPLFQVMFALQNVQVAEVGMPQLQASPLALPAATAKFELSLLLTEVGAALSGELEHNADLFDGTTAQRLGAHLEVLFAEVIARPGWRLSQLPLLAAGERHQLLAEWNDTAGGEWRERAVHRLIEDQVRRTPQARALAWGEEVWTYEHLNGWANRLARHLRWRGVRRGERVGVAVRRSPWMVASVLGVLKAGGSYVPLDPSYPAERLSYMLEDSGVRLVVSEDGLAAAGWLSGHRLLRVDGERAAIGRRRAGDLDLEVDPHETAYVIYTSGSTGRPKGVEISHGSLASFLATMRERPGLGPEDVVAAVTALSFDIAGLELYLPLMVGAAVVLASEEESGEGWRLLRRLKQGGATLLQATPVTWRMLLEAGWSGEPSLRALCGGEALGEDLARELTRHGREVWNLYGPTETTVWSTVGEIEEGERITIGRAVARTTAYAMSESQEVVPIGVLGELWIGGAGLARGYVGQPALTAERFVPSPFGEHGGRLYRTGDVVRRLADGRIEHLGRADHQVKVRGHRIELGEIESALAGQPGVAQAVVTVREESGGERRLVAYVVASGPVPEWEELRGYLAERLPDYMVPSAFVALSELPLTPNRKVDRRALPAPETAATRRESRPPRGPLEEVLAGIWSEVLGIERVGAEEDFFALGGHSLLATQVRSRVREAFEVELPLRSLFEAPSVAKLAARIGLERRGPQAPSIVPVPREGSLPLSFAQQRLWFLDQLAPGSAVYNIPLAVELRGRLEVVVLAAALAEVMRRHEALRTTFQAVAGKPVQVVAEGAAPGLPVIDLGSLPVKQRETEASCLVAAEARRPFDLGHGPLLRAALLSLEAERHVALVTMHHIVSDGWSMGVLVREIGELYAALLAGRPSSLPELAVQYADFAAWQRRRLSGELLESELAWWRGQLAGMPPALELPADYPRPAALSGRGEVHGFAIDGEALTGLTALSRRHGATLFMTLLAGFMGLLQRTTGGDDLAVGTPIAGRTRAETEPLIGLFVNTLVLRLDLSGDPDLVELLGRARERTLAAYAHQEVPFERLVEELAVERDLSRPPLVQALLVVQNAPAGPLELPGLELKASAVPTGTAKLELTVTFIETEGALSGTIEYSRDLFDGTTIERLAGHYTRLLSGAVAEPQQPLSQLPLLSPGERHQILGEWNDTATAYPSGVCLHELVAAQAERTPEAVAVVFEDELTYRELVDRSRQLACYLIALGVEPDDRVGVLLDRSLEMIVALLGVLTAGAAYVPLDPGLPAERLDVLTASAGLALILTRESHAALVPARAGRAVLLDAGWSEIAALPRQAPAVRVGEGNLAYVLYTSGSTGTPKGVMIPHRGIVNRLLWMQEAFGLTAADRVLQKTPFGFDVSLWELFWPLLTGARLIFARPEGHKDPQYLADLIAAEGITTLHFVPSMLEVFLETPALESLTSLRRVVASGEALPPQLVGRFFARLSHVELHNLYGPTEASVDVSFWPCAPALLRSPMPIGRPIANHRLHVVDRDLGAQPFGVPGELLLGGPGLARGYLGRPDLTAAAFIPDPFGGGAGTRLYRTGDLVRQSPDGNVQFLGRLDHQVKIRGFRIELGEIEAALARQPGVREAAVLVREDAPGDKRLVAYVVSAAEPGPSSEHLREALRRSLPEPMVPAAIVVLEHLPLTANGKVDRRALSRIAPVAVREAASYVAPQGPIAEMLAVIWAEVLGPGRVERVGAHDDFFALGGHSLLATQVISRLREAFGVELPVRAVFEAPTVAALASRLASPAGAGERLSQTALARTLREGRLPLSFAQQRLWFLDQLAPGSAAYNIPVAIELTGDLKLAVLAAALAEVVRRHEALRTTFQVVDGEPVQVVAARAELGPPVIDLRSLPAGTREEEANRLTTAEALRPFDLGDPRGGSLLRVALLRLAGEQHVALLTMHHIVSDGWSMGVLIREVSALYTACLEGRPSPLPELPIQYRDYALWQRSRLTGEVLEQEIASWREALAGIPVLQLPTDRPRPPVQTFRGAVRRFEVPGATTAALKALGQRQGGTLFMVLLAAFASLLHRYTGQDDVAIGSPAANRTRFQLEGLIGFFVNTLVLRIDLSGAPSFAALFARVRRASVDAFSHQELPFEKVVFELQPERNLSVSPLFQVMFSFQNAPMQSLSLPGLTLRPFAVETRTAKFDLTLDIGESAGGLAGSLEHNIDLFDRTTVDRMLGHLGRLLEAVTAEPGTSVADLPMLSAGERNQLLVEWNATDRPVPAGLVHEWIAAQAARTPEAVAVTFGAASLTYRELDRRANGLAWRLLDLGVGPEVRVGVALERSLEMVVGVLAVLKAGGAYVPLDPSYPAERLAFMVEDSGLATVLRSPLRVAEAAEAPHAGVGADNAAYVIYTSGSTGRPKGVQISHGALANLLAAMAERLGIGARDALLSVTSLSFDIAGLELYLPLMGGGRIVLASREEAADGQRLQELTAGATVLQATPATWRLLLDSRWQGGEGLKALCGGEALSPSLASSLLKRVGALWNCYGPTETTIWSTVEEVVQIAGAVAIGRPIANTEAYVLDRRGAPVPLGAPGELVLGGAGVARGYLGRPDLTAERFVPNPFGAPGSRMYRTGDLVRYRADGALGFLGRIDHQVKIRGFRVEIGEVEAVLASHPAVRASAVVALADRREDLRLAAYVVVDAEASVAGTPAELRAFLKQALPDSMVPSSFVFLAALPLTPSGKVDRRALPAPDGANLGSGAELAAPATAVEEVLAEIWRKVLGVTRVGRHDNFFDLGGHSLLLAELRQRLQERFGRELSMVEMFRHATVAAMAGHLAAGGAAEAPRPAEVPDRGAALRQGRERLKQRGERQARRAGERLPGGAR